MQPQWQNPPQGQPYPVPGQPYPAPAYPQPGAAPGYPYAAYPPPRKKGGALKIVLIVGGSLLLVLAAIVGLAVLFSIAVDERALTASERAKLLTIDDVVPYLENYEPDHSREVARFEKYIDGSYDMSYEYEHEGELYVNCIVTLEKKTGDAKMTYTGSKVGTNIGARLNEDGFKAVSRNDLFRWGDESEFSVLTMPVGPVGNWMVARKDKVVIYLCVTGIYFDDPETIREFLAPVLERATR